MLKLEGGGGGKEPTPEQGRVMKAMLFISCLHLLEALHTMQSMGHLAYLKEAIYVGRGKAWLPEGWYTGLWIGQSRLGLWPGLLHFFLGGGVERARHFTLITPLSTQVCK